MTTKEVERWLKKIKAREAGVSAERDKIRDLISQLEDLDGVCEVTIEALRSAADSLSELV